MASTEQGATQLSLPLSAEISSAISGFDADDDGGTVLTALAGVYSAISGFDTGGGTTALTALQGPYSAISGFDSDDGGVTALGTPPMCSSPRPQMVTYYKMRALDQNCAPSPPTYRTWIVTGSPDTDGSRYTGTRCGTYVNFTDVVVVDVWQQ